MKVRECVANIAVEFTHTGFVGRHVWLRCVVDESRPRTVLRKRRSLPFPWTSSVFRRTTAFAASDAVRVLIRGNCLRCVVLRERLAGFILANSTLSHVLSAATPAKKAANARLPPLEIFPTRKQNITNNQINQRPNHIRGRRRQSFSRRVGERSGKRVARNTMHEMRHHVSQKHSRKEAKEVVIPAHEACFSSLPSIFS